MPLNQPVQVPVEIKVGESGSYSAIVELIDPQADLVAHAVMTTVLVAQPLTKTNGYAASFKRTLERPGNTVALIDVPQGLSALKVRLKRADGEDFPWLWVQDPTGRTLPYHLYGSAQEDERRGVAVKGESIQTFENPVPGVWEFYLQEWSPTLKPAATRLKATDVTWDFAGYAVGQKADGVERSVAFTNEPAQEARAKAVGLGLGSASEREIVLHPGVEASLFELEVPEGASRIEAALEQESAAATVGLYIYKIPEHIEEMVGDQTALVYYDPSHQMRKSWVLEKPKAGKYVIAVDPINVPASGVKLRYRDVMYHPLFGTLSVDDKESLLGPGATRAVKVGWKLQAKPADGRSLVAEVGLIYAEAGYSKAAGKKGTPTENELEIVPIPVARQIIRLDP